MADELELTEARMSFDIDVDVAHIRERAAKFDKGHPGECFFCGEEFERVISVVWKEEDVDSCGRCRDRRGIA